MTRIVSVSSAPVDLFLAAGLSVAARTPGFKYRAQNIGGTTIRWAVAENIPNDRSQGFRLGSGAERDFNVGNFTTWAWTAGTPGRIAMEV